MILEVGFYRSQKKKRKTKPFKKSPTAAIPASFFLTSPLNKLEPHFLVGLIRFQHYFDFYRSHFALFVAIDNEEFPKLSIDLGSFWGEN